MNRRDFVRSSLALAAGAPLASRLSAVEAKLDDPIVDGNTRFALDLYAKLRGGTGNVFCSPYSISSALAMTAAAAAGATHAEMCKVLHLPDQPGMHVQFGAVQQGLLAGAASGGYQFHIANALWGQQGFAFRKEFLALTQKYYGAGLRQVDFHNPEAARKTINRWVEQQTKDKIKDLFPDGSIDATMRLVLTNAVYFKGDWANKFQPRATSDAMFRGGKSAKVPTMHQTARFGYAEGDGWQVLEMGYAKCPLVMDIILPRADDGLSVLEDRLNPNFLRNTLAAVAPERVQVSLPKFKATLGFDLTKTLAGMGMGLAFTPMADFSRMASGERLMIGVVVHKAFVDVNEQGTEAAAATGVGMKLAAAPVQQLPKVFRADHPFLVLIRDTTTGSILFLGRVTDPVA